MSPYPRGSILGFVLLLAFVGSCGTQPGVEPAADRPSVDRPGDDGSVGGGELPAPFAGEPRPAFQPKELASLALRPGYAGTEILEDPATGELLGVSGRLADNDLISTTSEQAALRFLVELGASAYGWMAPEKRIGLLHAPGGTVPFLKDDPQGQMQIQAHLAIQLFEAIPIESRQVSVLVASHSSEDGLAIGGYFGKLGPDPLNAPSPIPALDAEQAYRAITTEPSLDVYKVDLSWARKGLLVWTEPSPDQLTLAYRILAEDKLTHLRLSLLVDAQSGALISYYEDLETDLHNDAEVTSVNGVAASWDALQGQPITMLRDGSGHALARRVGQRGVVAVEDCGGAAPTTCPVLFRPTPDFTDAAYQPHRHGTDVFQHIDLTMRHYQQLFGWVSWDGRGSDLHLGINYSHPFAGTTWNAYARQGEMFFPNGTAPERGLIKPAGACLSVVAHEYFHNIIRAANELDYVFDSGAVNEALADLAGQSVRDWSSDWNGNECASPGTGGLRNIVDPTLGGQPDRFSAFMLRSNDNGGVHYNSGIVNKAHALMTRGGTFNGVAVSPLNPTLSESSRIMTRLVFSALQARLLPRNTSLRGYAAALYGWCRAQASLYGARGAASEASCATVHDAFVATELFSTTLLASDLAIEVDNMGVVQNLTPMSAPTPFRVTVRNRGLNPFLGEVRVEARDSTGTRGFPVMNGTHNLAPGAVSPVWTVGVDLRALLDQVPTHVVVDAIVEPPGTDDYLNNNRVRLSLTAAVYPVGVERLNDYGEEGALLAKLGATGNLPLFNGDIAARFLFRSTSNGRFDYVSNAPQQRLNASEPLFPPYPFRRIAPNLREPSTLGVSRPPIHQVAGPTERAGEQTYGKLWLHGDGVLRDATGRAMNGPVILLAVNTDGRFRGTEQSRFLFCMNCRSVATSGNSDYAVVIPTFEVVASNLFPSDLAPVVTSIQPRAVPEIQAIWLPTFNAWFPSLDPVPIPLPPPVGSLNAGP